MGLHVFPIPISFFFKLMSTHKKCLFLKSQNKT